MKWTGRLTVLVLLAGSALLRPLSNLSQEAEVLSRFEFTKAEMGLPFRIVLYSPNRDTARQAAQAAFDRIGQLNDIMSDYDLESELSRLAESSGTGQAISVSEDLWEVLAQSQRLSRLSEGAFDITVGPYVQLWRRARRVGELPPPALLSAAHERVGYANIELDDEHRTVTLKAPRMKLDLGGIAKGYAIDAALAVLAEHGIDRALVSGGGDIGVSEAPPGRPGWTIEIAPLDLPDAPKDKSVLLSRRAICTSGDLFQRVEIDGVRYSHIVNPKTGIGLTNRSLVTVIASTATVADSLATTVSVVGPAKGLDLIRETPGAEARVVFPSGTSVEAAESPGFEQYLVAPEKP